MLKCFVHILLTWTNNSYTATDDIFRILCLNIYQPIKNNFLFVSQNHFVLKLWNRTKTFFLCGYQVSKLWFTSVKTPYKYIDRGIKYYLFSYVWTFSDSNYIHYYLKSHYIQCAIYFTFLFLPFHPSSYQRSQQGMTGRAKRERVCVSVCPLQTNGECHNHWTV